MWMPLKMYLILICEIWSDNKYLSGVCRVNWGLTISNNRTRHKGWAKPLLFQPMPPLDLVSLRDCQKNAFIIPQNKTGRIFDVAHNDGESSNQLIIPELCWFGGFLPSGLFSQHDGTLYCSGYLLYHTSYLGGIFLLAHPYEGRQSKK